MSLLEKRGGGVIFKINEEININIKSLVGR